MSRPAAKTETSPDASFAGRLNAAAAETEQLLDRLLAAAPIEGEIARPHRVVEAMRYASLGGGKRLRPFLTVETAALFGVPRAQALMAGAAIEFVHCYSLVHDDLPAMDDDDLRRGRPTAHKEFDEATAILAGDGLLTLRLRCAGTAGDPSRRRRADRARDGPRPRRRPRRHGRRPDARPRRRRPLRQERHAAGRGGRADAAGDEDRRDPELLLHRRRHSRQRAAGQARRRRAATAR